MTNQPTYKDKKPSGQRNRFKSRPKGNSDENNKEKKFHQVENLESDIPANPSDERLDIVELQRRSLKELHEIAKEIKLPDYKQLKKNDLIFNILQAKTEKSAVILASGVLEILPDGDGFLRTNNYLPSAEDI